MKKIILFLIISFLFGVGQAFAAGVAYTGPAIDDSKGNGDTDYVWSADKIYDTIVAGDTAQDLDTAGDSGTGAVDLDSQSLTIAGTSNRITTSAANQTITLTLPQDIHSGASPTFVTLNATTFDTNVTAAAVTLSGTTLQADGTNTNIDIVIYPKGTGAVSVSGTTNYETNVTADDDLPNKKYTDDLITAQDLDLAGDSGTGAVDLDSQSLTIAGTTNRITSSAANQTITLTIPQDIHTGASPTFVTTKLSGLTDGYIPYHVADATGLADSPLSTDATQVTYTKTAIGVTPVDTNGIMIRNTTAAAAGAQQWSPPLIMQAQGWKTDATAASQKVEFMQDVRSVQGAAAPTGYWGLYPSIADGAYSATPALTVDSAGKVGVGTAAPDGNLHIYGAGTKILHMESTDNYAELKLSGTINYLTSVTGVLSIYTGAAERMRIDTGGLVGINTTLPQSLLDIQGDAGAAGILTLATKELTVVAADELGRINFNAPLETGADAILPGASIWAVAENDFDATNNPTSLIFATGSSEAAAEKWRIDSTGALKATDSSADPLLDLNPSGVGSQTIIDITPSAAITSAASDWFGLYINATALDPGVSAVEAMIHGVHSDLSGILRTRNPETVAIHGMGVAAANVVGQYSPGNAGRFDGEVHINFDATKAIAGVNLTAVDIVIDTTGTSAGQTHAIDVALAGGGTQEVYGLAVHPGVGLVEQFAGSFASPGANYAGRRTGGGGNYVDNIDAQSVFVADNDAIFVGSTSTFTEIEIIMTTGATKSVTPSFYYNTAANTWVQFFPADDTDGFQQSGDIRLGAAPAGWTNDGDPDQGGGSGSDVGYWIRIDRTRNGTVGSPIVATAKISSPTKYSWDSSGNVTIAALSITPASAIDGLVITQGNAADVSYYNSNLTHGGYITRIFAATSGTLTGATDKIELNIPSGWRILQCQLHVKTAVVNDGNDTWSSELNDGAQEEVITAGSAAAQNTNVDHWADEETWGTLTDAETDILLTPQAANFTAGEIEAHCLCKGFDAWDAE